MAIEKIKVGKDKRDKKAVEQTILEQIEKAKTIADIKEILKKIVTHKDN